MHIAHADQRFESAFQLLEPSKLIGLAGNDNIEFKLAGCSALLRGTLLQRCLFASFVRVYFDMMVVTAASVPVLVIVVVVVIVPATVSMIVVVPMLVIVPVPVPVPVRAS